MEHSRLNCKAYKVHKVSLKRRMAMTHMHISKITKLFTNKTHPAATWTQKKTRIGEYS